MITYTLGFIKKLLDGVAVEWKELSEIVTTVTAPSKLKKSELLLKRKHSYH